MLYISKTIDNHDDLDTCCKGTWIDLDGLISANWWTPTFLPMQVPARAFGRLHEYQALAVQKHAFVWFENLLTPCSFGWWLMADADLF
jgi:hypothetical protein